MALLYDIRTREASLLTLSELLEDNESAISHYLDSSSSNVYPEDVIKHEYKTAILNLQLSDISVCAFHIAGCIDCARSISETGIVDLLTAISPTMLLGRVLNKFGVVYNKSTSLLSVDGNSIDMDWNRWKESPESPLKRIARRLSLDSNVNGFLHNDRPCDYGDQICRCPEFLTDLSEAFEGKPRRLRDVWLKYSIPYRIDFRIGLETIDELTFGICGDKTCKSLNKALVNTAIKGYYQHELPIYLKQGAMVAPDNIIKLSKLK